MTKTTMTEFKVDDWVVVNEGVILVGGAVGRDVHLGGLYGQIVHRYGPGFFRVRLSANELEMNFTDDELPLDKISLS